MKLTAANEAIRAQNVTASEVAALMEGGHPYTDRVAIFDRLAGTGIRRESEAMSIGSAMESAILHYAMERDDFAAKLNAKTFVHPHVRLCATPDAFVTKAPPWVMVPERALVEIKMSGRNDMWRELPSHVEWQARAQLACTGRDVVYIYCLVGMRLLRHAVYREAAKEIALAEAVATFWRDHIVAGVRPEPADPVPPMIFTFEGDGATADKETA